MLTGPWGLSCRVQGVCLKCVQAQGHVGHVVTFTNPPQSCVCVNSHRKGDSRRAPQGPGPLAPCPGMVTVPSCSPRPPPSTTLQPEGDRHRTLTLVPEAGPSVMVPLPGAGPTIQGCSRREQGQGQAWPPLRGWTRGWGNRRPGHAPRGRAAHSSLHVPWGDPLLTQSHRLGTCRRPGGPRC